MKQCVLVLLMAPAFCVASGQQLENQAPATTLQQSKQLEEALRLTTSAVDLYAEGKFDDAASPAKRALQIREKILNADDKLVVNAVLNLAEIQWARERTSEAKLLFERALQSYERMPGGDANMIKVLDRLALLNYQMGKPDETEKSYQRALAVGEKLYAIDSSGMASLIFNLAEFYQFEGDYTKAEPLYRRVIAMREKSAAGKESMAEARDRYACLLRKAQRVQEATELESPAPDAEAPKAIPHAPIEGGVLNGKATYLAQPPYPKEARVSGVRGRMRVRILIDETGRVIRACAVEGSKLFMKVTESAARRSMFTATLLSGRPVKVNGLIIYNFQ